MAASLRVGADGGVTTLFIAGELDLASVEAVRAALVDLLRSEPPRVVVDMGEVTFIDAVALGVLVSAMKRGEASGGRLQIVRPQPRVMRVFEMAGVSDLLRP